MPLYLSEEDVEALLAPGDAVAAVERLLLGGGPAARGATPWSRLDTDGGSLAVAAGDAGDGRAAAESVVRGGASSASALCLFDAGDGAWTAVLAGGPLTRLRAAAAGAIAARHLARDGARAVGVIGTGALAAALVETLRATVPGVERVRAWGPSPERLRAFCAANDVEAAESSADAGACDVVVTATSSHDPVLRGDWLRPGTLVLALGATVPGARELDDATVRRASFVCCDSVELARRAAGDLIEPVANGVLDWLEVHELRELVAGETPGRAAPEDVVLFKAAGAPSWSAALAALAVDRAVAAGAGTRL